MSSSEAVSNSSVDSDVEAATSSDLSLSESWTVLDTSHFTDDGDLSDAESVEVLSNEEQPTDGNHVETNFHETIDLGSLSSSASVNVSSRSRTEGILESSCLKEDFKENTNEALDQEDFTEVLDKADSTPQESESLMASLGKLFIWRENAFEFGAYTVPNLILHICIISLVIDVILLSYFAVFVWSGIFGEQPVASALKNSNSYQQFEMDPLGLHLSHVLAEWKKKPLEDHSLDRHVLKTLLLYYGGNTELSANIHSLKEKVQRHDDLLQRFSKSKDENDGDYYRMAVSGYLAHSVAYILGNQDTRAMPTNSFLTVNNMSEKTSDFAPEPGFWLNDWYLPQYMKANDTRYQVDSKAVLPPMHNLFLHLGSAKWNQYFWELYHDIKNVDNDSKAEVVTGKKVSDIDLEVEETERSPLDAPLVVDFLSSEESSGSPYPLFVSDLGTDDYRDEKNEKFEHLGSYFKVQDGGNYLERDSTSSYECLDGGCKPYEEFNVQRDQSWQGPESRRKGKLIQLFEEFAEDESQSDDFLDMAFLLDLQESNVKRSRNLLKDLPLRSFQHEEGIHETFDETFNKGKLSELFEEDACYKSLNDGLADKLSIESSKTEDLGEFKNFDPESEDMEQVKTIYDIEDEFSFNGLEEDKRSETKEGASKNKIVQQNSDTSNVKTKEKKRKKGKHSFVKSDPELKKKLRKKNLRKKLKLEKNEDRVGNDFLEHNDGTLPEKINMKVKFLEERYPDWNTRMAKGREKQRALKEMRDKQHWVFERAQARHDMREELHSQ